MTKSTRQRPTVALVKALEARIQELESTQGTDALDGQAALDEANNTILELRDKLQAATEQADSGETANRLKDTQALLVEAEAKIQRLESQLADALEGKDHSQGADLPPVEAGRERFFVDLGPVHAEYLKRVAAREQRELGNMIERIIRIDWAASPDKGGAISTQAGEVGSMPASDAPQIPVTR